MRRLLPVLVAMPLFACATPGAHYFHGEGHGCEDVRAARPYADSHPEITPDRRADWLIDLAHCEAEAGNTDAVEPLLAEAEKLDPQGSAGDADAERAALAAQKGDLEGAQRLLHKAVGEGFDDLDTLLDGEEFARLLRAPVLERDLVALAAAKDPVEPRLLALAEKLKQNPVTPVVVDANPKFGLNTFVLWRGRLLESHYDEDNDETTVLLEEVVPHAHAPGGPEAHQHFDLVWTPQGPMRKPHSHLRLSGEQSLEYEATGRLFGLRVTGFPRELVEAPDLEVVGYYIGGSPFSYRGEGVDAPTLQLVRAVPFNSGVHLGTPVAHE